MKPYCKVLPIHSVGNKSEKNVEFILILILRLVHASVILNA